MKKNSLTRVLAFMLALVLMCGTVVTSPVSVDAAAKAKKITLTKTSQTLYVGKSFTLKVKKVTPKNASKAVTYKSDNTAVVTVNKKGKVTAKGIGKATVTVTSKGNKKAVAKCKFTVKQGVKTIQTAASLTMQKGKKVALKYGVAPANAANKKVKFSTSNKKVATVDKKGKITAKKPGSAKITVKSADGCAKATVKVKVKKKITAATSVTLNKTALDMVPGASETLAATVAPAKAAGKKVYWVSSNAAVATVSKSGAVKAVADGTATITAVASDHSGKSAVCTVTVKTPVPPTPVEPTPVPPTPVDPKVEVESVAVDPTEVTLKVGETATATATVAPANATDKTITWSTSDANIATVDNGTITAVAAGTATVTAASSNGKTATVAVTVVKEEPPVPEKIEVTSITLDKTELALVEGGDAVQLTATVNPENATDKTVAWKTSNAKVATVSDTGLVTPVAEGNARIIVEAANGVKAECAVTVTAKAVEPPTPDVIEVESVTVDPTEVTLKVGKTAAVTATVAPANATDKTITWSTSDEAVATVAEDGTITAVAAGTATVTATSNNGKTATVAVTVEEADNLVDRTEEGITSIVADANKDLTVTYTIGGKTIEQTITAEQMDKAYNKYLEALEEIESVEQVWDKVTDDVVAKLSKKAVELAAEKTDKLDGKEVSVETTTIGNTKVVTAVCGEYTQKAVVTLVNDTITVTASNGKLTDGERSVVISDIDVEGMTAKVTSDGYTVDLAWSETEITISKGESTISATYVDGKYALEIDDFFAAEIYSEILAATTITDDRIPATYEELISTLVVVEEK
ncbi:MAG: Ig-like domain-containing protein [Lachnospiraceae bacterium]|nr:Ig-like domain-containing protein [Lachnospiraceae bacterium]